MPLGTGHSPVGHPPSLDLGTLDVPFWAAETAIPLPTSTQDAFFDIPADMNVPLYDFYSPFQIEAPWDEGLQQDMEYIPLLSNELHDFTFYNSHGPVATESESILVEPDLHTSSSLPESAKALELRNLMPKPLFPLSDTFSGTDSDEAAEESSSKLGRRRCLTEEEKKATALMRQIGACARCISKKAKAST